MKEHQIRDSEGSGSSTATRSAGFFRLGGSCPSPANRSHRFSTTGCREGPRRGQRRPAFGTGTLAPRGFCTREGGRCQRRRADGWAKGSEMDGQLLLFRPPPCQASVIKAIHHPPWGGGSLPCSDTTASFSVVHHSGERGVGEQGRGRGSQREPAQQTAKAAPLRRPRPAPNAGSVHWLRPRARHSYWGLRVVVSADEAPWKQG